MKIVDTSAEIPSGLTDEQQATLCAVAKAVRGYLGASAELLDTKYRHLRDLAPAHLATPGNTLVAYCNDGVVIRYEKNVTPFKVFGAFLPDNLSKAALLLSQNLVRCYEPGQPDSLPEAAGFELTLFTERPSTNERNDFLSSRILFNAVISPPEHRPQPPLKPLCALCVRSSFELQLLGQFTAESGTSVQGQRFIVRKTLELPVGWECIEVYPYLKPSDWNPDYAHVWAENDILAAVATQQFREESFRSLDPTAESRRQYGLVLNDLKTLLDSEPEREQTLQAFLQNRPELLCPTHTKMWPKLALGSRETDFVFRDACEDYLLVELERSTRRLFRKDGHVSAELNHARDQIADWKRYLEDNLATVQRELGLTGISANSRSLVVIGRSRSLTPENRRTLVTMQNEQPRLRIMTYDDVYENAKAVIENLMGPLWETGGSTQIYYIRRP